MARSRDAYVRAQPAQPGWIDSPPDMGLGSWVLGPAGRLGLGSWGQPEGWVLGLGSWGRRRPDFGVKTRKKMYPS